jgi:hypothetical protein
MKTLKQFILMIAALILIVNQVEAGTRYSVATGDWDNTSTWSTTSGGASGASVPGPGDIVIIEKAFTVTVNGTTESCDSIYIKNSSSTASTKLVIDGGSLTVTDGFDLYANISASKNSVFRVQNNAVVTIGGDLVCKATKRTADFDVDGGTVTISGDLILNSAATSKVASATISGGSDVTVSGDVVFSALSIDKSRLILEDSATFNLAGNLDRTATDNYGELECGVNTTFNFNGTSPQVLSILSYGSYTQNWYYGEVLINNTAGVTLDTSLYSGWTANRIAENLRVQSGTLYSGGYSIDLVSGKTFEVANGARFYTTTTDSVSGMIDISTGATQTMGATSTIEFGAIGNQYIPNVGANYGTLATSGSGARIMTANINVDGDLELNSGIIDLATFVLTLSATSSTTGSPGSGSYVCADNSGRFRKEFSAAGSFTFPIGDVDDYSPATLNFTSGTFAGGAYADMNLADSVHGNMIGTSYISRIWYPAVSGISSYSVDGSFTYTDADVNGTEASISAARWNGATWDLGGSVNDGGNQIDYTLTDLSGDISGGQAALLPITLVSFFANVTNDGVEVHWTTSTEIDNDYFIVERSQDGVNFTEVGRVYGAGTSYTALSYQLKDENPHTGWSYYRLTQVDFNDGTTVFTPVSVNVPIINNIQVKVWPNPANTVQPLNVQIKNISPDKEVLVLLIDQFGREVYSKVVVENNGSVITGIDHKGKIAPGVYFVVASDDKTIYKEKLIIQ